MSTTRVKLQLIDNYANTWWVDLPTVMLADGNTIFISPKDNPRVSSGWLTIVTINYLIAQKIIIVTCEPNMLSAGFQVDLLDFLSTLEQADYAIDSL